MGEGEMSGRHFRLDIPTVIDQICMNHGDRLTTWEQKFLERMEILIDRGEQLSHGQISKVEEIRDRFA